MSEIRIPPHSLPGTVILPAQRLGEADVAVLLLNRAAVRQMTCEQELAVVPQATHLFEEPGTLEQVQELAAKRLGRHCRPQPR